MIDYVCSTYARALTIDVFACEALSGYRDEGGRRVSQLSRYHSATCSPGIGRSVSKRHEIKNIDSAVTWPEDPKLILSIQVVMN